MGFGFLIVLLSIVALSTGKVLPASGPHDKRSAPDPLLGEIFNDPSATSLTKSDLNDNDASGSGLGSGTDIDEENDVTSISTQDSATEQKLPGVTRAQLDEQGMENMMYDPTRVKKTGIPSAPSLSKKKSQIVAKANKKYDINAPFQDNVPQPTINSEYSPEAAFFADKLPPSPAQASDQAPDQAPDQAQADSPPENKEAEPELEFPQAPAAGFTNNTQVPFAPNPMISQMAQPINDQLPVQQPASDQLAQLQQPFNDQAFQTPQDQPMLNNQTAMAPELQQQINDQYGLAAQQQQQMSDQYGVAPQQPMVDQYGQPIAQPQQSPYGVLDASQQAVPVFQGQTPKKPFIEKDECADQFDSCPDMAKNKYCEKYVALMKVQCKKSCKFCEPKKKPIEDKPEGSGSSPKDHAGSGLSDYVWDTSGSGEGSWDSSSSGSDDMEIKKSTIPSGLLKKVLAPKLQPKQDAQDDGSAASGVWDASGSGSELQQETQGESGSGLEKRTEIPTPDAGSGSGDEAQPADEIASGSGAELAEDLATGTISKNVKHSEIPAAPVPDPLPAGPPAYPKIDLKEIAKAVSLYKHVALKMLGEAIKDGANEYAEEEAKRNNIPTMPSGTEILQNMGFPVEDPKSVVPNPLGPNFDDQNAYSYNPSEQTLNNFYGEQQPNVVKSDVAQPEEQPQANVTEPETPKDEEKTDDDSKKSDIDDPYQYVRNMGKGASLTPIAARPGANLILHKSSSQPLVLHKSSQWSSVLAKKKTDIPRPSANVVVQNVADASQRYDVPQINMTAQAQQPALDTAQAYSQYTPESQLLMESVPQEANLRSDLTTSETQALIQPQLQGEAEDEEIRELRSFLPEGN